MAEKKKIAIQGFRGSFHEMAAQKFFGNSIECIGCESFRDLFNRMKKKECDYAVAAIENTVAGTILPNYALLRNSDSVIIGEVYLRIQQNLLALPGDKLEDIREVRSHPMAIMQCDEFFEKHPGIKLIESVDTALSAQEIAEQKLRGIGAIAGLSAAEAFGLNVLAPSIETNKKNFTRFLVLKDRSKSNGVSNPDKASLCFNVPHRKGSLAQVLTIIAFHDLNLTKIQSLPLLGKEWEYYIHIDLEYDNYEKYREAIDKLKPSLEEFSVLGEYKRGEKYN
jgi:prephenate dehydratase